MAHSSHSPSPANVQIEIPLHKLESLFRKGELCAAEMHCLNAASKRAIWRLCLACCTQPNASEPTAKVDCQKFLAQVAAPEMPLRLVK